MAEERIDIEVTDKVDPNAAKKIEAIAKAADRGHTYVEKLKAALSSVNTSSVDKLASAMARADSAQARLINAQVRLTASQDSGALAAAKLATQQQKLATEAARTEAATARAAAASSSAESAALRLAAAQQRVTGASQQAASAEEMLAADTAALSARFAAGEMNIRAYVNELSRLNSAAASASTATQQIAGATDRATAAAGRYQGAARQTNHVNANIIAQMQDIGVSLAGGQNPLLVMIQQGSQLSYIATTMDGGMKSLLGTMLRLIAPFTLIAGAVGLLYKGFGDFTSEMASKHKPGLESYAQTLGLTSAEMKKLSNETVGANGKLKEFDQLTITNADSWKGFVDTVMQGLSGLVEGWGVYNEYISTAWSATTKFMYNAFLGFYGAVHTLIELIWKTFVNVTRIIANAIIGIANSVVMVVQDVINAAISGINLLSDGANWVMGNLGMDTVIPQIDKVDLGIKSVMQGFTKLESMDIGATMTGRIQEANRTIEGFSKAWDEAANAAARARIEALAAAIIQNRGPGAKGPKGKVDRTAEKEAFNIGMVNMKLDDELARMKMLKQERDIQQKMDQIEQSLAQKKIKLNDTERASILAKVTAIEEYKYVQAESDRIVEAAIGPQRTLTAATTAAHQEYERGSIDIERYTEELRKATRAYNEATDPLFKYNEAISSNMRLTGLYGVELEKANYLEQLRQDLATQGKSIYDANTGALTAEVQALVAKNNALREQQFIQSQLGGVLNPILEQQQMLAGETAVYAELQRLRDQDKINEEAYQQAKYALWVKYNEMRLSAASSFFGDLASVTARGHGAIGVISKAAAVAQATIDGFVATQKALASAPPPWNFIAAAGVALKTGANVAGILSTNAGSFKDGGQFMVDGKSGVDANNINMNVTKGERVTIETAAQQRANDAANGGGAPTVINKTKVVNQFDERSFIGAMDSEDGEEVVMNIIRRRSSDTKNLLGMGG